MSEITPDAAEVEIEEAVAADDMGLADSLYQLQIGNTDPYGDKAEAAAVEAGALAVSDTKGADPPQASTGELVVATTAHDDTATISGGMDFAGNPGDVARALEYMEVWDYDENGALTGGLVEELKAEWGSDMGANLGFFQAFALAHPDIHEILVASGFGDHPAIIRVGAMLGRRYATKSGDPGQITTKKAGAKVMEHMNTAAIEAQIKTLERDIERAQAEQDPDVDALYQRQQALYRLLPGGSEPIVGEGGVTV